MKMTPLAIVLGSLLILAAVVLVVVFWPYTTRDDTPSEIFRSRSAEERAGRAIYIANGCVYCHSQSIRAIDWGHGAERIAQAGDYVADRPILLGSQRTGVDLSQEGGGNTRMTGTSPTSSTLAIRDPIRSCLPLSGLAWIRSRP